MPAPVLGSRQFFVARLAGRAGGSQRKIVSQPPPARVWTATPYASAARWRTGASNVTAAPRGGVAAEAATTATSAAASAQTRAARITRKLCLRRADSGVRAPARGLRDGVKVEHHADADHDPACDVDRPGRDVDEDVEQRRPRQEDHAEQRQEPAGERAVDVVREQPEQDDRQARREDGDQREETAHTASI